MAQVDYATPIGRLVITGQEDAVHSVMFEDGDELQHTYSESLPKEVKLAYKEIKAYFEGKGKDFTFAMEPQTGTPFQREVWQSLRTIPYGETGSYLQIATSINRPKAVRAVGGANGRNPFTVVLPCHRIIGANGKMVGYTGGLWRKEWLLAHEQKFKTTLAD
ncbi:cysteine methyltransferase [Chryseomicrobium excrementi]|uniref:Methylated-DNA--protein-cysteine methyltransferase n=1 Tax=Chryseomicrobium excrementi TaxID=2041346 RepID=A0A2M9EYP9_9BACL|nr:methylated-DNA--[protein]-cysteine S-methyltransferase [Chryseomicrobium excrementi]PJK16326.1 cysteine methyltransferase [Chryseomicrobium excrementi]